MTGPVTRINGVWHWQREPGFVCTSRSPLGHTLHCMESGDYTLVLNNRVHQIKAGDIIAYGPAETHHWQGSDNPAAFFSVNFLAPELSVPPPDKRVTNGGTELEALFTELHGAFIRRGSTSASFEAMACLYRILACLAEHAPPGEDGENADLWMGLERIILDRRLFRAGTRDLAALSGYCESTVYKACVRSRGVSPLERVRALRMEEARFLLEHTALSVGEIATSLGYPRIHEFSRDFSAVQGQSPPGLRRIRSS